MRSLLITLGVVAVTASSGVSQTLSPPPNIEKIDQRGDLLTVKDNVTGLIQYLRLEENTAPMALTTIPANGSTNGIAALNDTCFAFWKIAHIASLPLAWIGNADRDELVDVAGNLYGSSLFYEFDGDTIFVFQDSIHDAPPMDYGGDTDGDGNAELMTCSRWGMTLYESPDSFSFPVDSVFYSQWPDLGAPTKMPGGFTDINGDNIVELSFRPNFMCIEALRNTGDNQYEHNFYINHPDSLLDNYGDYVYGDLDQDDKIELITSGSLGRVLCFENVMPDSFVFVWTGSVSHYNAYNVLGPTDMDNDGILEFVVMSKSLAMGGYFYYFFETRGDNSFEQVYVDSLPGDAWSSSFGFTLCDLDNNGIDEMAVSTLWWVGIIEAAGNDHFEYSYLKQEIKGAIVPANIDNDSYGELLFRYHLDYGMDFEEYTPGLGIHGDANCDCRVNQLDILYMINYFKGFDYHLPIDRFQTDANGSCSINGLDITYYVNFFKGGPELINADCE